MSNLNWKALSTSIYSRIKFYIYYRYSSRTDEINKTSDIMNKKLFLKSKKHLLMLALYVYSDVSIICIYNVYEHNAGARCAVTLVFCKILIENS